MLFSPLERDSLNPKIKMESSARVSCPPGMAGGRTSHILISWVRTEFFPCKRMYVTENACQGADSNC